MPKTARIAGIPRPLRDLVLGVLYLGDPGTGKSSLIFKQIRDAIAAGDSGVVLDVSDESTDRILQKGGRGVKVKRIDVRRKGGTGLDIAVLLDRESRWHQFAVKVCPDIKGDNHPFFREMVRLILVAVMGSLTRLCGSKWTLGDLVKIARDPKLVSAVAKQSPNSFDPYSLLGDNDSMRDVAGTVLSVLGKLSVFAALNDRCEEKVSPLWPLEGPKQWMVFVRDDRFSSIDEVIHALVVDVQAEEALSRLTDVRFHIVCDEVRSYPRLEFIIEAIRRGRKSAVAVTLSVHSLSGMYDRYGEHPANEILGLLAHKVVLRCGCPITADWASKVLGVPRVLLDIAPKGYMATAYTRSVKEDPNVIADIIRRGLRHASWDEDRIEGYVDFPSVTAPFECPFRDDMEGVVRVERGAVPPEWETLPRFKVEDCDRLNIKLTSEVCKALGIEKP